MIFNLVGWCADFKFLKCGNVVVSWYSNNLEVIHSLSTHTNITCFQLVFMLIIAIKKLSSLNGTEMSLSVHHLFLQVKRQVYLHYLQSIGSFLTTTTIVLNIIFQMFSIGSSLWLSEWSSDTSIIVNGTLDTGKRDLYLGVYAGLGLGQGEFWSKCKMSSGCVLVFTKYLYFIIIEQKHWCLFYLFYVWTQHISTLCAEESTTLS